MTPDEPESTEPVVAAQDPPDADAPSGGHLSHEDLSWVEHQGPWILLAGAGLAWVLAAWFADHEPVSTAWVLAGFVLLAAAAYFHRVIKIGKEGLELAQIAKAISRARRAPPVPDDTPDEVRARLAQRVFAEVATEVAGVPTAGEPPRPQAPAEPPERQVAMERDRVENNVVASVFNWLGGQGWDVRIQSADDVRADLVATRDIRTIAVEARPHVESLRRTDAAAIVARVPPVSGEELHRAVVFREGVWMDQETRNLLENGGLAIWAADPDVGSIRVIAAGHLGDVT